ncbi:ferritin family protein [bacterium]|nr:ferritin family protein [candidate division CSSED10-310 bacterium]
MADYFELEKLFVVATQREIEAYEFYAEAARVTKDRNVKEIFQQLAQEERGHFELLERFRANPADLITVSAPSSDWKIAESEEMPTLSTEMKPKDAIALAMKKEQQAVDFYRSLSSAATTSETRFMFENLANMELTHKHRLENMYIDVGYPEVF